MQQPQPNNNFIPQPSFNTNYMQQPMPNPEDITDPTTAINMALVLMAKAFKLNYSTPTNNNQRISSNPRNRQITQPAGLKTDKSMHMVGGNRGNQFRQYAGQNVGNQNGYNAIQNVGNQNANQIGNGNVVAARDEGNANGNNGSQIRCYNCRGLGIQLQAEEFDFMATAGDLEEIEEVNANCILMANLQQASTSGTQTDNARVYDSDGSAEPHMIQQNNSNVIYVESSVEHNGGTVEQHHATVEETRSYFESLYNNLAIEVEKANSINALHLSFAKMITTLNEEIANLNNQLSKEKSTISSLQEEKKKLKSDFKIREDELLDKQIQLENKIKELDNILTDDELTKKEVNQMEADDQAIQIIQLAARDEGYANGNNGSQIRCYNCRGLGRGRDPTQKAEETFDFNGALPSETLIKIRSSMLTASLNGLFACAKHQHRVLKLTMLVSMTQMDQLSVEHNGGTVEEHHATVEETRSYFESLYNNLAIEVEKANSVNRKMK
ncbi:hypothetical protein Tco_0356162 [Tanacetum coccineum]